VHETKKAKTAGGAHGFARSPSLVMRAGGCHTFISYRLWRTARYLQWGSVRYLTSVVSKHKRSSIWFGSNGVQLAFHISDGEGYNRRFFFSIWQHPTDSSGQFSIHGQQKFNSHMLAILNETCKNLPNADDDHRDIDNVVVCIPRTMTTGHCRPVNAVNTTICWTPGPTYFLPIRLPFYLTSRDARAFKEQLY